MPLADIDKSAIGATFLTRFVLKPARPGTKRSQHRAANLLAGPGWKGETPPSIKQVIRSETQFVFVFYVRSQTCVRCLALGA